MATNWFALTGYEENGWTAIRFKYSLNAWDRFDVPITIRCLFMLENY